MEALAAFIPLDRRRALAQGQDLPHRTSGAALFVDISGFSKLTSDLVTRLGERAGVDELTRQLNQVYGALIAQIHRFGGSVIGFSGDGMGCWFDQATTEPDDQAALRKAGLFATACGLELQKVMKQFDQIEMAAGITVSLGIKAAVVVGPIRRFLVGDPGIQYIDVLAGATMDRLDHTESQAQKGEVVLGPQAALLLKDDVRVVRRRPISSDRPWERCAVVTRVTYRLDDWPSRDLTPTEEAAADLASVLAEEQLRCWLPPLVYQRLQTGQDRFLAELRRTVSLFINFSGIDYDHDEAAGEKLDDYVRWVQRVLDRYEGYLIQLTSGDKGIYLYASFGAVLAHDDDPIRAVAAAIELRQPPPAFDFLQNIRIGMSLGKMRTGAYGSPIRRTYGVLGDEVNMAARLMQKAESGQILISERIANVIKQRYQCHYLGASPVKGRDIPLPYYEVQDDTVPAPSRPGVFLAQPFSEGPVSLDKMMPIFEAAQAGRGQLFRIDRMAEVDKSQLVAGLVRQAQAQNFRVAIGTCQVDQQETPYYPWQQIFRLLFDLPSAKSSSQQVACLEALVTETDLEWLRLLPLLGELVGLEIPDNETTSVFGPAQLRQGALFAVTMEVVQTWAARQPLFILLDETQYLDSASLSLAQALAQIIQDMPVLFVLLQTPYIKIGESESTGFSLNRLPHDNYLDVDGRLSSNLMAKGTQADGDPSSTQIWKKVTAPERSLVGRQQEQKLLEQKLIALLYDRQGGVVALEGEAGIGKSRLLADMLPKVQAMGLTALIGYGDAIEKSTPYHAWRPVFRQLFNLDALPEDPTMRNTHVLARLPTGADSELLGLAPLLNAVLPIDLPDNEITQQMTGQVRAENTRVLLVRVLQQVVDRQPLLLIFEDAHWMDSASWALADIVSQEVQPLLMILAIRPAAGGIAPQYQQWLNSPTSTKLRLETLSARDTLTLVCNRLGVNALPDRVAALIRSRAEGHPFFSEELAYALHEAGFIEIQDGVCRVAAHIRDVNRISLPDTIEGVITSRIDRLSAEQQLTLKIASVIGRVFPFSTLYDVYPFQTHKPELPHSLDHLERLDITLIATPDPDLTYMFKHSITQEIAYNLMILTQRQQLHRAIAAWYEQAYADDLSDWYALLAHHWSQAQDVVKALFYLEKSGEQALRNGVYQEAINFFRQALTQDTRSDGQEVRVQRARWEGYLGEAYLGLGQLAESRAAFGRAVTILGWPVPNNALKTVLSITKQLLWQSLHRVVLYSFGRRESFKFDRNFLRRLPASQTAFLVGARAYEQLTELYIYANQTLLSFDASLRALNLAEQVGPSPELARAYANMCLAVGFVPIRPLAESYSRRARILARRSQQGLLQAHVLSRTSMYDIVIGRWQQASQSLATSIDIAKRFRYWRRLGEALILKSMLDYCRGDFESSRNLLAELHLLGNQTGNVQHQTWGMNGRSLHFWQAGESEKAIRVLQETLPLFSVSEDLVQEIFAYSVMALAYLRAGMQEAALEALEAAQRVIDRAPPTPLSAFANYIGGALVSLALWEESQHLSTVQQKSFAKLAQRGCRVLRVYAWIFPVGQPRIWLYLGLYHWLSGRQTRANKAWHKSLAISTRLNMPYEQALAYYEIGRHLPADDPDRQRYLRQAQSIFERLGAIHDLAMVQAIL